MIFTMSLEYENVFGRMANRDIVSWIAVIAAYVGMDLIQKLRKNPKKGSKADISRCCYLYMHFKGLWQCKMSR